MSRLHDLPLDEDGSMHQRSRPHLRRRALLAGVILSVAVTATTLPPTAADPAPRVAMVVVAVPGADPAAAVARVGGTVVDHLSAVGAVVAEVPANRVDDLTADPTVHAAGVDRPVAPAATIRNSTYDVLTHAGSPINLTRITGAQTAWASGATGEGVTIAVIDTGIVRAKALGGKAKVDEGPSTEAGGKATVDGFGHGTAMGSLAAGRQEGAKAGDPTQFLGMAPEAKLLSVKVSDDTGATTVASVMAGIDWVIANARRRNIRVLNLSLGAVAPSSCGNDPLAVAAERAWLAGIVVVASAGNAGVGAGLSSPACNPYVIAVGAQDLRGTADPADDLVAEFSSTAPTTNGRLPDLVAPGTSVLSVLAPNSVIAADAPASSIIAGQFVVGSGTSQATAVTSGAAALLLSHRPTLTPDQVKALLVGAARPITGVSPLAQGAGRLDVARALTLPTPTAVQSYGPPPAETAPATSKKVSTGGNRWTGNRWSGNRWSGNRWSGSRWTNVSFEADAWTFAGF